MNYWFVKKKWDILMLDIKFLFSGQVETLQIKFIQGCSD